MKFLVAFLSALFLSTSAMAQVVPDDVVYKTNLSGAKQVPPVVTGITAEFIQTTLDNRWYLVVLGAPRDDQIVAAHIHCAKTGMNGPVVYPFYGGAPRRNLLIKGSIEDSKFAPYVVDPMVCPVEIKTLPQLRLAIRAGYIYVNVHTQKHPGGAVRGQVFRLI